MINALSTALFARLDDQLSVDVYDYVPQVDDAGAAADFPYVVIDGFRSQERDTNDAVGFTGSVRVHVWSRYRGRKEAEELQAEIFTALHQYNLTVTGYGVSSIYQELSEVLRENDTITHHGIQQFRVILEPTS